MLRSCLIENYRSIRHLELPLGRITVLLGANGTGKTNCYRALQLAHAAARGRMAEHFAEEGGMPSALWAGDRQIKDRHAMRLTLALTADAFDYHLACGMPVPHSYGQPQDRFTVFTAKPSCFGADPEVKEERITIPQERGRPLTLCERSGLVCKACDRGGQWITYSDPLDLSESVLSQISDPRQYSELAMVRESLSRWRFYHQFRTDRAAALRQPRLAVRSPVLSSDGDNLASALQTIIELDGEEELLRIIKAAFPDQLLLIEEDDHGRLTVALHKQGLHRPLTIGELSDGTLRFLCLAAALLSPRPPLFLALNEPESSLHPDLIPMLARLIAAAGERGQLLVTTHSQVLAQAIAAETGNQPLQLTQSATGETVLQHEMGLLRSVNPRPTQRSRGSDGTSASS
jgi:predicted ATPase